MCRIFLFGHSIKWNLKISKHFKDNASKNGHDVPNVFLTYAIMVLTIIIFVALIYFNYGLLRGSTPNDGTVIKRWLLVHKILMGCILIILILQIILDTKHITEIAIDAGTVIVILIEIVVVHKFYKELTTSGVENQSATIQLSRLLLSYYARHFFNLLVHPNLKAIEEEPCIAY
ncbi:hypothetical protein FWK35_00014516 [Aphis craccivora]|uniref:Uncharacterized protein n=1 Tax=Aphis craccivora TaxID=307492 RepID=A0A6G0YTZ1_APHCR|nr:hypothetical protein FWK35_00014516 [Aphis craccivora]